MKYFEKQAWPLTCSTTPYCGAHHVCAESKTTRFATALYRVKLDFSKVEETHVSWEELSALRHDSGMICVGYSSTGDWEALALLNTTRIREQNQPNTAQTSSSHALNHERTTSHTTLDDSTTIGSTTARASAHQRTTSSESIVSNVNNSLLANESNSLLPEIELASATAPASTSTDRHCRQSSNPISAQLLLLYKDSIFASRMLDFRPLTPKMACFTSLQGNEVSGIFMGSSDHSKLYWFTSEPTIESDRSKQLLSEVPLTHPAFAVSSCVMGLDFWFSQNTNAVFLALTCQDGTIAYVNFQYDESKLPSNDPFVVISQENVIVDGPVTSVQLYTQDSTVRVTAGSLCGYATELIFSEDPSSWEGPFMVAQGFTNGVGDEDSVLVVHACDAFVCLGLLSGRFLLYAKNEGHFRWQWEVQLPYSIHGVCVLPMMDGDASPMILVTTRRSLHLFASQANVSGMSTKLGYNAEIARARISKMAQILQER